MQRWKPRAPRWSPQVTAVIRHLPWWGFLKHFTFFVHCFLIIIIYLTWSFLGDVKSNLPVLHLHFKGEHSHICPFCPPLPIRKSTFKDALVISVDTRSCFGLNLCHLLLVYSTVVVPNQHHPGEICSGGPLWAFLHRKETVHLSLKVKM